MKKRNKMLAISLVVSGMLVVGCGTVQEAKLEKIGLDAAKEVALKEAGIVDERIVFTSSELDSKNNKEYYDIDFIADGHKYEYDIDALTGIVIESKKPVIKEEKEEMYTKEEMEEKVNELWELYKQREEEIEKHEEEIEKLEEEMKIQLPISDEEAKEIALRHAGVKKEDATFVTVYPKEEDGFIGYEVEFFDNNHVEYDYFIDINLGIILDFDSDAEYTYASENNNSKSSLNIQSENVIEEGLEVVETISEQKAKEIALAQVPGAAEKDIYGFEVDRDDGRVSYEGSIVYNEMEYDFEIDGYSGAIREWDAESIYD